MQMAKSNKSSHSNFDVPLPIVLAIVVVLIAGFLPYISPRAFRGALPTELPILVVDPLTSATSHQHVSRRAVPTYLNDALDRVGESTLSRDAAQVANASRVFADALIQAGGDDLSVRAGLREAQLDRMISHAQNRTRDPLVLVAQRHGLLLSNSSAALARARAWFSFRWEAAGARAVLSAEQAPLEQLVGRLLADDRKALLSWVFSVSCETLMGLREPTAFSRQSIERCTAARRDFLALAPQVDAGYPVALASASLLCLEALYFRHTAIGATDPSMRAVLERLAHDDLGRAHNEYQAVLAGQVDPQQRPVIERYFYGTERVASLAFEP